MSSSQSICIESTLLVLALKRPRRRLHVRDGRELANGVFIVHHGECQRTRAFPSDRNEWNFFNLSKLSCAECFAIWCAILFAGFTEFRQEIFFFSFFSMLVNQVVNTIRGMVFINVLTFNFSFVAVGDV